MPINKKAFNRNVGKLIRSQFEKGKSFYQTCNGTKWLSRYYVNVKVGLKQY